jgi:chromosome segregation ATPase
MSDENNPGGGPGGEENKTFDKSYVEELRNESAKYRTQRNELKTKLEESEKKAKEFDDLMKKQQEEQGKFKELYEAEKKKAERLPDLEARLAKNEEYFKGQLDEVLKGLTAKEKELFNDLPEMSTEERLKWAKKLSATKAGVNSPASERAGGGAALNEEEWKKIISDKEKMIDLSINDRPFYEKLIAFKKQKLIKE